MTEEDIHGKIAEIREKSLKEGLPVMRTETSEILGRIIKEKQPEEVLEIGTCIGVSGITVLAAGGKKLTTVEIDGARAEKARKNFNECGFGNRVNIIEGDCREVLRYLEGNEYGAIILDGPKSDLAYQYEASMGMLKKGGIIFIDDINYHGMIKAEGAPHKQRTIIKAMRLFLERLKTDERVEVKIYETEDGIAVAEKIK